jgi:hypothetical protein
LLTGSTAHHDISVTLFTPAPLSSISLKTCSLAGVGPWLWLALALVLVPAGVLLAYH